MANKLQIIGHPLAILTAAAAKGRPIRIPPCFDLCLFLIFTEALNGYMPHGKEAGNFHSKAAMKCQVWEVHF